MTPSHLKIPTLTIACAILRQVSNISNFYAMARSLRSPSFDVHAHPHVCLRTYRTSLIFRRVRLGGDHPRGSDPYAPQYRPRAVQSRHGTQGMGWVRKVGRVSQGIPGRVSGWIEAEPPPNCTSLTALHQGKLIVVHEKLRQSSMVTLPPKFFWTRHKWDWRPFLSHSSITQILYILVYV